MKGLLRVACCGLAACGGSNVDRFVGSWKYSSGQEVATCLLIGHVTQPLDGTAITLTQNSSGELAETTPNGCQMTFKITGETASLVGMPSCMIAIPNVLDGGVIQTTIAYQSENFTIDPKGTTLTESGSFSTTIYSLPCTIATSGTLSKL